MTGNEGNRIGEEAELRVALDLIDNGCHVAHTFGHAHPYDLIADTRNELLKIQVKKARHDKNRRYKIELDDPDKYNSENVDLFAGYVAPEDAEVYIPYQEMDENSGKRHSINFASKSAMGPEINWERANRPSKYTFEAACSRLPLSPSLPEES